MGGLEFYSFVADNYAPFYSRPVECTDRDAPFVLDGVLYHESDLNLEEHYTDTHGYTEINFAAFGMVGMRFCPRIRSLHRQRIYCADPARDHGVLEPVLQRGRRAVNCRLIAEQWDAGRALPMPPPPVAAEHRALGAPYPDSRCSRPEDFDGSIPDVANTVSMSDFSRGSAAHLLYSKC